MAKFGSDKLGWKDDPKEAAFIAMAQMVGNRYQLEVIILRWEGKEIGTPDQEMAVPDFRLERI